MHLQEEWFDAVQEAIMKERELKEQKQADEEKGIIKRIAGLRNSITKAPDEEITRYGSQATNTIRD